MVCGAPTPRTLLTFTQSPYPPSSYSHLASMDRFQDPSSSLGFLWIWISSRSLSPYRYLFLPLIDTPSRRSFYSTRLSVIVISVFQPCSRNQTSHHIIYINPPWFEFISVALSRYLKRRMLLCTSSAMTDQRERANFPFRLVRTQFWTSRLWCVGARPLPHAPGLSLRSCVRLLVCLVRGPAVRFLSGLVRLSRNAIFRSASVCKILRGREHSLRSDSGDLFILLCVKLPLTRDGCQSNPRTVFSSLKSVL